MKAVRTQIAMIVAASVFGTAETVRADDTIAKFDKGILVAPSGMTLYTFDKDPAGAGKSVCNGPCATIWPPLMASANVSGEFSIVTRDDGSKQIAYKGRPLYFYTPDRKPGDMSGDGSGGVWHAVRTPAQSSAQQSDYSAYMGGSLGSY